MRLGYAIAIVLLAGVMIAAGQARGQAGDPLPGLTAEQRVAFEKGREAFKEDTDVAHGLGPRFNALSCGGCHAHPAIGGTSPAVNPQAALASPTNRLPPFITAGGPVRVARFIFAPKKTGRGDDRNIGHGNGHERERETLDGGVHALFVISGRADVSPACNIVQPEFARELSRHNVIFRIPTPVFGLGLVEDIPDSVLLDNAVTDRRLGISPHFNYSGNDGTITKFGWKAQNKSLLLFSGEAYNVEQGVTNWIFPNEREDYPGCRYTATPEDTRNDIIMQSDFMRLSAPPAPPPDTEATRRGQQLFASVGCAACHTPVQTTRDGRAFSPYSDFSLHPMGDGLSDGILQGNAAADEFRSAPLWGVGKRLFFLHDGRTTSLEQAVLAHESKDSQANTVIKQFRALPAADRQAIIDFLREL